MKLPDDVKLEIKDTWNAILACSITFWFLGTTTVMLCLEVTTENKNKDEAEVETPLHDYELPPLCSPQSSTSGSHTRCAHLVRALRRVSWDSPSHSTR